PPLAFGTVLPGGGAPVDEWGRLSFRRGFARLLDQPVIGRETARGIGGGRIPGEKKGLAATAPEVELAAVAAPARLGHPAEAAEGREARGVAPDLLERTLSHRVEVKPGKGVGRVARQDEAVGADHDESPPP